MTKLTENRNTALRDCVLTGREVAADTRIFAGSLTALNAAGYLVPASAVAAQKVCGRAEGEVDNRGGADGARVAIVRRGIFGWENNGTITRTHVLASAYAVDDQTVAADNGGGTRPVAGRIMEIDRNGLIWVETV